MSPFAPRKKRSQLKQRVTRHDFKVRWVISDAAPRTRNVDPHVVSTNPQSIAVATESIVDGTDTLALRAAGDNPSNRPYVHVFEIAEYPIRAEETEIASVICGQERRRKSCSTAIRKSQNGRALRPDNPELASDESDSELPLSSRPSLCSNLCRRICTNSSFNSTRSKRSCG